MLINELAIFYEIPEDINDAVQLTIYAVSTRYPGEYDEITKDEYEKMVTITKNCLDWVEERIKENVEKN